MSRRWLCVTIACATGFPALFIAVACAPPHPRVLWNASASAPIGLYWLHVDDKPVVGDMAAVAPPSPLADFMAERHYLPLGVPLLKHVAAGPGARICRRNSQVTIDGRIVAIAFRSDSHGRPLPDWRGCHVLEAREVFLLNPARDSFDGRYFGPISVTRLIGRATPILTPATSDTPHCRGSAAASPAPPINVEGEVSCR